MTRAALLAGTGTHTDPALSRLRAPGPDVDGLARVLADPQVGAYGVDRLVDRTAAELRSTLRAFFANRAPDDVLLVYFSGHGVKDVAGELYLAGTDTRLDDLDGTAVSAAELNRWIRACRSRHVLLVLDCCYSGAFGRGMFAKAGDTVLVQENFSGRGLAIITATTAIEYAFEGTTLRSDAPAASASVFTEALTRGLDTGEADDDLDQRITLDELYYYVFDTVREANPAQTPCWWLIGGQGEFVVAARRPGTSARRVRSAEPVPAVELKPDRGALALTVPVALAGGALVWAGLAGFSSGRLWSLVALGLVVVLAAVVRTAVAFLGRVRLEDHGIRVSLLRSSAVPWPAVLAVETRAGLFGRTVALHRGDRRRLPLPAPSASWTSRRARFSAGLDAIRDHSISRGSPTAVARRGWAVAPARVVPVLALVVVLLFATDRPWLWEGTIATSPPDACQVLDKNTAADLAGIGDAGGVNDMIGPLYSALFGPINEQPPVSEHSDLGNRCTRRYAANISGANGAIALAYALSVATESESAHNAAGEALARSRSSDGEHGQIHEEGLHHPGYWLSYDNHGVARELCGNVVTTITFDMSGEFTAPGPKALAPAVEKAVRTLTDENPGLC
ncbi:caspase domain-containing protein [Amycolatopsis sp. NPDC051903]|uniref:caspase domain-containing protein n=1 Tax=Amycolatopsis sp. NPDC051903 TaxID=3363936 RepID=UPI0037A7E3F9